MDKFVLVEGYVSIDNTQLHIDINNLKKDVKDRGGWLVVFFTLVGVSTFRSFRNDKYFEKISHYIDFGLRVIGMITIVLIFWYLIFRKKSKKKLIINEITSIEVSKEEFETELVIQFSDKREIDLNFRNLEDQVIPFLETLKKRNTRIKIEYISNE